MTKELVKSENGHKIIKHARHGRTHSLSSSFRIKMRFTTPWLIIFYLAVASGDQESIYDVQMKKTTDGDLLKSPTEKTEMTNNLPPSATNDDDDLASEKNLLDEMLFFQSLVDEEDKINEETNENSSNINSEKDNIDNSPENPTESKISKDVIDIRRQGEINSENKAENSGSGIQFDDSETEVTSDSPPQLGRRSRKPKQRVQDGAPLLQLTQGGYDSPYKLSRFRNRYISKPDSSEQSDNIQEPDRISNGRPQIVPQVTYSSSPQLPYAFPQRPFHPAYDSSARDMLALNHVIPSTAHNGFFSAPSRDFTNYPTNAFQQFPQSSDAGGFTNLATNPNNAPLYQSSQRNPFQTPGILFQTAPQVQTQPILMDPRNAQQQFQPNPFISHPAFENMEDNQTPNYAMFFSNPATNTPFQIPTNFYGNAPNAINTFNNPPISFLSNYPNADDKVPSQFLRYPGITETRNNQQTSNDQQFDSDASQEDKEAKAEKAVNKPANRDDPSSTPYGSRLLTENIADVYMRYPTNEAGYATEENLPPQNNSEESKDNNRQTSFEQTNFLSGDPNKNVLNSAWNNQRLNNSFDFPPELFRDAPINFEYHRPQGGIFNQYPDRNRGVFHYPSPTFESRSPFSPLPSLPENNNQFVNVNNQQRVQEETVGIPSCAKQNNASFCFEDSSYPGNDVVYSLNSNSFVADRLSGPQLAPSSFAFVERNANNSDQNEESYACEVDTKYGEPLRAKNVAGAWRVIVNLRGIFSQPVRMEVCKSLGDSCSYAGPGIKTTCVQKYSLQRLLTWSPGRGIFSDVYKIPVACSCQILDNVQA